MHEADKPLCAAAVMVAVPGLTALILPVADTVAIWGLLEIHLTVLYLVFLGKRIALIVYDRPGFNVRAALLKAMDETARDRTTSVQEAETPLWAVAMI